MASPVLHGVSRRVVLAGAGFALGSATTGALIVPVAAEDEKLSQADAQYQPTPRGAYHCEVCSNFQPPSACRFVQGQVSPDGWCQLFTPKP